MNQRTKQIFKVISIIFLFILASSSAVFLFIMGLIKIDDIFSLMVNNEAFLIINIATVFMPILIAALVSILGYYVTIILNFIGIIIALITLKNASKTKKILLYILIALFIIMIIFAIIMNKGVNPNA